MAFRFSYRHANRSAVYQDKPEAVECSVPSIHVFTSTYLKHFLWFSFRYLFGCRKAERNLFMMKQIWQQILNVVNLVWYVSFAMGMLTVPGMLDRLCVWTLLLCSISGYNFDAISCESCKAFFRRNALRSLVIPFGNSNAVNLEFSSAGNVQMPWWWPL